MESSTSAAALQPGLATGGGAVVEMSAVALSKAIHGRELSCLEVLDAYCAQIDRLNPVVNALVAPLDRDWLRGRSRELDTLLARGQSLGPLHGFPQAPKDIMPAAGMVTTKGSPIFANQLSQADCVVFERMRAGGALFVARSNSPEFGLGGHTYNPVYGTTRNAFDPSRSAGGSSGGAGVAVALRMLPVADGSDMMGSLRTPAAFNHVYGLRTSVGCVPHGPSEEVFFQQFSVAGPMARDIPDLALLLSVQAGFDARLPLTRRSEPPQDWTAQLQRDCKGLRIGWLGDLGGHLPTEPGLLQTCRAALQHFTAAGCTVEEAVPQFDFERLWRAWIDLRSFSVAGANAALYNDPAKRALLKPEAVWEIERGLALPAMAVYDAARVRSAWYETLRRLFDSYDFLVLPSAQVFPFDAALDWPHAVDGREMDTYHRWMQTVVPATMAGLPALAAPAGFGPQGLPAGLQIIGPAQADLAVLQIGHAYDQASGLSRVRSPLLD
ncbi:MULTISPECIES: amidase [Delftia]|uniref:Amidase n=1 Tax=Delftia lacustris TaxID=558537 RepID=A0A7T2YWD9_9BURK|nr:MULTISPECIES: amidase [Delftia]KAA9159285.1 amidase [Delftia sp. BR1]PZP69987.1 MAG: amidase [Delftia acidovorans]EPD40944.1 amidase [Delftia acidovorans CCUG 15835]EPD44710.1 amidase [Delftia acidovorans CCUG 274B]MBS3722504.1 Acylamidase [Delftia sp. PE138]